MKLSLGPLAWRLCFFVSTAAQEDGSCGMVLCSVFFCSWLSLLCPRSHVSVVDTCRHVATTSLHFADQCERSTSARRHSRQSSCPSWTWLWCTRQRVLCFELQLDRPILFFVARRMLASHRLTALDHLVPHPRSLTITEPRERFRVVVVLL